MDILRSFLTVSDLGSVTRAGKLIGRSQPAISLQLKRLDELLDCHLFCKEGTGLILSPEGERFSHYARQILALNDEAVADLSKDRLIGKLRLGIPGEFAPRLLPKILGSFSQAYPGISLEINCDLSKNLLLSRFENYDVILVLAEPGSKLSRRAVRKDDLVWVGSKPIIRSGTDALPLVVAKEPCIYRERALRVLDAARIPWNIVYTSSDLTGIIAALREGLGITAMTRQTVPDSFEILSNLNQFPALGKVELHLLHEKKRENDALFRLVDHIRESLV